MLAVRQPGQASQCCAILRTAWLGLAVVWVCCVGQDALASNEEGQKYLVENGKKSDVVTLPSGLQYRVLKSGPPEGVTPNISSPCVVHYKGLLPNGAKYMIATPPPVQLYNFKA